MLKILGTALVIALAIGFALGGRIKYLASLKFGRLPLLYIALLLGLAPLFFSIRSGISQAMLYGGYVLVAAFILMNLRGRRRGIVAGMTLLLFGWLLNVIPIAANSGMPLSLWAYRQAGQIDNPTPGRGGFFKIVIADARTRVKFLGDVIPVHAVRQVVSPGDLILVGGLTVIIIAGMQLDSDDGDSTVQREEESSATTTNRLTQR